MGLLGLVLTACLPSKPPTGPSIEPAPPVVDDSLGPGDVFEVRVFGEKELSNTYKVGNDGSFEFPLIGRITAEGKTPSKVASEITRRLKPDYLKDPQVTVAVKEVHSKKIVVFGQVNKPGTLKYEQNMSIIQAITEAGGFNALANKNETTVTRVVGGKKQKIRVPVEQMLEGSDRTFVLLPGDIIFVPERLF